MRFVLAVFLTCYASVLFAASPVTTIHFGKKGRIRYDGETGRFTVTINGVTVLQNVTGSFLDDDGRTVQMPAAVEVSKNLAVDRLGMYHRYVFSGMAGALRVNRIFYVYEGLNGFYTELEIKGPHAGSRKMQVLDARLRPGYEMAFIMPFDNDAWVRYRADKIDTVQRWSSEVTVLCSRDNYRGLVIGSITQADWKTGVRIDGPQRQLGVTAGFTNVDITRDAIQHGRVSEGDSLCRSSRILVMAAKDWRDGLEFYAHQINIWNQRYNMQPLTGGKPFIWNSWGSMQTKLSLANALKVNRFFADSIPQFRNATGEVYIDLDSYWDNLVKGGLEGDFSQLKAFADDCRRKGLKPGIYWAPFVDWGKNKRRVEGSKWQYEDAWTRVNGGYHEMDGCRAMDPTHPATRERIAYLIKKFKDCGFELIKIDFLGHAAIEADHFYDSTVHTGMQAFREGMEFLCDQLDNKMLIYAAISPNIATSRYVHVRRIACDAFGSAKDAEYTLNGVSFGWWLGHLYNYIDADHVVFKQEQYSRPNWLRIGSALVTGAIVLEDDFSANTGWEKIRKVLTDSVWLQLLQQARPFRPVAFPVGNGAANCFISSTKDTAYLAMFNYDNHQTVITLDMHIPGGTRVKRISAPDIQLPGRKNRYVKMASESVYIFRLTNKKARF